MNKNYGTDIKKALFLTSPQKMKPFHPSKPSKKKKRKAGREHPWNMEPKEKEEDIGVEREGCEGGSSILLAEGLVLDAGRHGGRRG